MRILSVKVEGTPFIGYDRWGRPIYTSDPEQVMEWLCNGWRYRFNRVRSRRMKYADPDHMLLEPSAILWTIGRKAKPKTTSHGSRPCPTV